MMRDDSEVDAATADLTPGGRTSTVVSVIDLGNEQTSVAGSVADLGRESTVSISAVDGTWAAATATTPEKTIPGEATVTADSESDTSAVATAKETYVWKAKLAQEAGRYEDMAAYMRLAIETGLPTNKDEDNMLAAAYKRVLDAKRSSRRTLAAVELKADVVPWEAVVARRYRARVDAELRALCAEMLSLVDRWLSSAHAAAAITQDPATGVFYWKLRADYNRYAAEAAATDDPASRAAAVADSRAAYERADHLGRHALLPVDPIRLGLMLNYSVFLYQVCQQRRQGHDLAKGAFDDAVAQIDAIDAQMYDDATLILRLIRDNLTVWVQENGGVAFDENPPTAAAAAATVTANRSVQTTMATTTPPPPPPPPLPPPPPTFLPDTDGPSLWSFDEADT